MIPQSVDALRGRTIRCLLFDLGNTLWTHVDQASWDRVAYAATQRAIDFLRPYLPPQQQSIITTLAHGKQLRTTVHAKLFELSCLHPGIEPQPSLAVQEALLELGLPCLDHTICREFFEALRISTDESRVLFDDTCSTLADLQGRGFLLGVVTNRPWGDKPFVEAMQKLGLLAYFDPRSLAISADLGIRKPNPAIFLHTLNALNVAPTEAIMVGDSLYADITGAKALHMITIWKPKLHLRAELQVRQSVDDNALFTYAWEVEAKRYQLTYKPLRPDATIEHLHDLLAIVSDVGLQ